MSNHDFEETVFRGKLLEIDLTKQTHSTTLVSMDDARKWLGGVSLALKILYERVPANKDPFAPENPFIVMTGPLTGTLCPGNRQVLVHKSPHTGLENNSYIGGGFGSALKRAGFDGIIVSGRAESPVWLQVTDKEVIIHDAKNYWGKDAYYAEEKIKLETKLPNSKLLTIGQGGENLVTYACVNSDYYSQAGRAGTGAIMGSKRLKSIQANGNIPIKHKDTPGFIEVAKEAHKDLRESGGMYRFRKWGTGSSIKWASERDLQPTYNFSAGKYDYIDNYSQDVHENEFWVQDKGCYGCPVGCKKLGVLKTGPYAGTVVEGVEYELAALLGANLGIKSLDLLVKANDLVDRYALDGISTGATIGWAIEAYKKGLFTEQDTDGMVLEWGEAATILGLIEQIALQSTSLGKLLGKGVRYAADQKKQNSDQYAMHVKGLELPGWGSRGSPAMALAYATSDRGACHMRSYALIYDVSGVTLPNGTVAERYSTAGKGEAVVNDQNNKFSSNSCVSCFFTAGTINNDRFVDMIRAGMGWDDYSMEEYRRVGERAWNLTRLFNAREGINRATDEILPWRLLNEPLPTGEAKGHVVEIAQLRELLDEYYTHRGWSLETGLPTKEKLNELGLDGF